MSVSLIFSKSSFEIWLSNNKFCNSHTPKTLVKSKIVCRQQTWKINCDWCEVFLFIKIIFFTKTAKLKCIVFLPMQTSHIDNFKAFFSLYYDQVRERETTLWDKYIVVKNLNTSMTRWFENVPYNIAIAIDCAVSWKIYFKNCVRICLKLKRS